MNKYFLIVCLAICLDIHAQDDYDSMIAAMEAAKLQQDSIDMSRLVVVYGYECRTQDADGQAVVDRMKVAVQIGNHVTRSYPYRKFREDADAIDYLSPNNYPVLKAESYCFMPEVWTGYPEGKQTVRDHIMPNHYETCQALQPIRWTLKEDTVTVGGYLCQTATCELYGRKWLACYADDIPTTAGPWKLGGLPGLIVAAQTADGIHRFRLVSVQRIATPIYYEHNAITIKLSEEKLIKRRQKIFGNKHYPKCPTYYIPDRQSLNNSADVTFGQVSDDSFCIINGVLENHDAHVYQPLEIK